MKSALAPAAILAVVLTAGAAPHARQFRSSLDVVEVYATVRTSDGAFARDLKREDFEILDNGKRREIAVFSGDVQPSTIAMVLDRSGSVANRTVQISGAAEVFVSKLTPADRVSLSSLMWDCLPLTKDKEMLVATARSRMPADFGSPIWGGTNRALSAIAGEGGRRAILLFSDGVDTPEFFTPIVGTLMPVGFNTPCVLMRDASLASIGDIVNRAEREGVMLYAVSVDNASAAAKDDDLRRVARESGGERYRLSDYEELPQAFERIADELHHQYLLGFVPAVFDGKRHEIEVRVKQRGVNVRARKSYVAVRTTAASPAPAAGGGESTPISAAPVGAVDLVWAIARGQAGQRIQASCMANTTFSKEGEDNHYALVVAEGPVGRIMRAAGEAKQSRTPFTAADVSDAMRAQTLEISAELKRATDIPSFTGVNIGPARLVTMRVRSKEMIASFLEPFEQAQMRLVVTRSQPPLVQHFDLAAFKALPGDDAEVVVHSQAGQRKCTIPAKDKAALR